MKKLLETKRSNATASETKVSETFILKKLAHIAGELTIIWANTKLQFRTSPQESKTTQIGNMSIL